MLHLLKLKIYHKEGRKPMTKNKNTSRIARILLVIITKPKLYVF